MSVETIWLQPVCFAALGALAVELLKLTEIRSLPKQDRPNLREFYYWLPFVVLPLLGGGLAYVYVMSDIVLKPILAVNIGISAPLIFRAMASAAPSVGKGIDPGSGA